MKQGPFTSTRFFDVVVLPVVNILAAFLISGIVVMAIGEDPIEVSRLMLVGSLGSFYGIGYTLYYATSFIFAGLAVAIVFQAGQFNVGVEGQAYVAGLGAAAVIPLSQVLPAFLVLPAGIVCAAAIGAFWGFIPGYMQARRGSHIVISTIMLNWVAAILMSFLLVKVLRRAGSMIPESGPFPPESYLAKASTILGWIGISVPNTPLNIAFLLALVAAVLVYLMIWHTPVGYEIRTVGANPSAALYGGISPGRTIIFVMTVSGALASGVAVNQLLGVEHRVLLEFVAGFGFVGIAVALMGRGHPLGVVLASILFGMLYQGGAELAFEKPAITRDMIVLIQGLVVLFAGALQGMLRRHLKNLGRVVRARSGASYGNV